MDRFLFSSLNYPKPHKSTNTKPPIHLPQIMDRVCSDAADKYEAYKRQRQVLACHI